MIFTTFIRTITFIPVLVSPAPRRAALPTVVHAKSGVTAPTIRRKRVAERAASQPGKVHRGHDPRGEELHQQQRENPQTQTHRKRLAAEPGGLVGSSRTHRPSHQRRAANRASEFRVFLYISKRVSMLNLGNLGRLWTTKSHAGDPY